MRRSPFKRLRERQFNVGLQQSHFVPTERFLKHMDDSTACAVSSKVVEDLNTYQNNASQDSNWGSNYRRPQSALAATTNAQLLYTVHKYKAPSCAAPTDYNIVILEKEDLAPLSKVSMDFAAVEQGGATAPYWTCPAERVGVPTAGLHDLMTMVSYGVDYLLGKIWCGFISDSNHNLVFRLHGDTAKTSRVSPEQWYVGMHHFHESACLVRPVEIQRSPAA